MNRTTQTAPVERDRQPFPKPRSVIRTGPFVLTAILVAMLGACDQTRTMGTGLQGVWRSRGYGIIAQIAPDEVRLIERTPVSCLLTHEYSMNRFLSKVKVRPHDHQRTFGIRNDGTLSTITFEPLVNGGFDRLCPTGLTPQTDDPELNFEVLWHTFDQDYAFFSERHVDWDAVYAAYRSRIGRKTTREELGKTLAKILSKLGDQHVSLSINGNDVVSARSRLTTRLLRECREQRGADCRLGDYLEDRYASFERTLRGVYLKNRFKTAFRKDAIWGRIGESTGYFRIDSMAGLAARGHSSGKDLAALRPVLDEMLEDLGGLPNMIIDVRQNGGGHDAVALAIASRFADKRRIFGSKRAFENGHRTRAQDLVVQPGAGVRYRGHVAILTSSETASAAEVFALAMRSLPHVTLIGEPTMGIFSDELYRSLPNGWEFSLSNEIYLGPNGELFEAVGIPPHVLVPFLSREDRRSDVDSAIEVAMAILTRGSVN